MRRVLPLAGLAEPEPLDGLGEDHRGPAGRRHRLGIGIPDLAGIVTAAVEVPDLLVRHVGDHRLQVGIRAEEMLARIGAALGLEVLVFAVHGFFHALAQQARRVAGQQRVPARAPQHLDDVPAGAEEGGLELLDDLAVAAHRAVEPLQVAVDDEHEIVELLAHRHRDRTHRLGLVHLAVAEEGPDLAIGRLDQPAVLQIPRKARLVDRHHRPESHRHGRELPEVRHQPRVGIRRQALAADFLAEVMQLVFAQPAFKIRTRIDARARVTLDKHQVAGVGVGGRPPEMVEPHFVERRRRGVGRQVAAVLRALAVGRDDHGERIPADIRLETPLDRAVAGVRPFLRRADAVHVCRVGLERQVGTRPAGVVDHPLQQIVGALRAVHLEDRVDGLEPFLALERVDILDLLIFAHAYLCLGL